MWWKVIGGIVVILSVVWFIRAATKPIPGTKIEDMGRDHVTAEIVESTQYNSNPPTSGPHFEIWTKPGIYSEPRPRGELIHSLEHGYVVINYNCDVEEQARVGSRVYAQESDVDQATQAADMEAPTVTDSASTNESESCTTLQKQLEDVAKQHELYKLIVVPDPTIDHRVALTAWTYIDVMNAVDEDRIGAFIDFHRDHGPEQTME